MSTVKCKPRIALSSGQWYAFAPNRSKPAMQLLWPAIGFCRMLNARRIAKVKGGAA